MCVMVFASSCVCTLSQIPPQVIYAGANSCEAPLPNYLTKITASDNCALSSLTQVPAVGYLLTATNKIATVKVRATDNAGNWKEIQFTVSLVDTVRPVFHIDPTLTAQNLQKANDVYDAADRMIYWESKRMDAIIRDTSATSAFPPDSFPNLRNVYRDSSYLKDMMITWTAKGHAVTGFGARYFTFVQDADSIIYIKRRNF